jgi:hypothetical protein
MSIEAMKQAYQLLLTEPHAPTVCDQLEVILRQAIAEAEKQDGVCQHCAGKGCVACDAREQEPVAWMFQHDETGRMTYLSNDGFHNPTMFIEMNPRYALVCSLYTHPPKREWVGTTEKDVHECFMLTEFDYHVDFNRDPEQWCLAFAKELSDTLKQKNGYAEENT